MKTLINDYTGECVEGVVPAICIWLMVGALAGLFTLMILNGAMGCNRIATDNCILVQHVWELGL